MTQPVQPAPVLRYLRAALGAGADGPADADLLARFAVDRDQGAFELLVWRYAGMVLRVSRGVLRDHHAAEDVTQAAFLALARKAGSVGRRGAVGAWLYRVAYRLAVRSAARRRPAAADDLDRLPAVTTDDADSDATRLLQAELAKLPDKYRAPVLLCFFDGLSHADAARRLGWPVGTVAGRIARAKDWLHRRLVGRGVTVPAAGVAVLVGADAVVAPAFAAVTARAAAAFAAGAVVPEVSLTVLELAKGAIRAMTITKLQWAAGVLVACGAVTLGSVLVAGQRPGVGSADGTQPAAAGTPDAGEGAAPAKPAERTADFVQRQRSVKNLRTLMAAMHNYEATYGKFPADITDKAGKPILSWRVELLPYLEQGELYKAFKRTEPWDSEHNLKLLAQMPDVLRVGFEPKGATHTYYQRFAFTGNALGGPVSVGGDASGPGGTGSPDGGGTSGALGTGTPPPGGAVPPGPGGLGSAGGLPPGGAGLGAPAAPGTGGLPPPGGGATAPTEPRFPLQMGQITDGTSNTLGVIEAGPAVPWSKPADFVVDTGKPLPAMTFPFTNVRHAGALDGSAWSLRPDLDPKVFRLLIDPNDGQVIPGMKNLHARFPAESAEEQKMLARLLEENDVLVAAIQKEFEDHAALLAVINKVTKEFGKAEEHQEELKVILEGMKARNKKLRDEIGLPRGARIPEVKEQKK